MIKITPLMISLHEGHKAEERLKCIDNMLFNKCEDTKDTILQAFWWYRRNSIPLDKIKQAREEIDDLDYLINDAKYSDQETRAYNVDMLVTEFYEIMDNLIAEIEN